MEIESIKNIPFFYHFPKIAISIAVKLAEKTIAINELFLDLKAETAKENKKIEEQLKKDEIRKEIKE